MQQISLKSVKAKLLKRSVQGNRRKFNRSCSMSSKEYEMTNAPMKGDTVDVLTMSPHLSHFGSLCQHFFAWGLFPPSASRVLFVWHARSAEEFTPPPLGEALNQWPVGVGINTPALSPRSSSERQFIGASVVGCLPFPVSLPHWSTGSFRCHPPDKLLELQ